MKTQVLKLWLLALMLLSFSGHSQTLKSFYLKSNDISDTLNSNVIKDSLKVKLSIANDYLFDFKIINGQKASSFQDDLGITHERYSQYYKGIKIENSDIRIRYKNNLFISANGEYVNIPYIDTTTNVSSSTAIQYAMNYINADKYIWEDSLEVKSLRIIINDSLATFYPQPELIICKNSFDFEDTTLHIAYKMIIYTSDISKQKYVYVDAKNGDILDAIPIFIDIDGSADTRYSGTRTISTHYN